MGTDPWGPHELLCAREAVSPKAGGSLTLIELLSCFTFCSSCSRSCFKSELHLSNFCFSSSLAGKKELFLTINSLKRPVFRMFAKEDLLPKVPRAPVGAQGFPFPFPCTGMLRGLPGASAWLHRNKIYLSFFLPRKCYTIFHFIH